jgi:hypothetical protein
MESDDNSGGFELGKVTADTIHIIDGEQEALFNIIVKGSDFSVKGVGDLFDESWQTPMNKFCKGGKRSINDVLVKASVLYNEILEGGDDDDEGSEEEVEIEVDGLDEEEEPKPVPKGNNEAVQMEELKRKFKKPEGVSEGAVNCIVKEYIKLCNEEETKSYGYSCHPIDDDLFHVSRILMNTNRNSGKFVCSTLIKKRRSRKIWKSLPKSLDKTIFNST